MSKRYREHPSNFSEIEEYVVSDKSEVVNLLFRGNNYFFYDTCSLLHHSKIPSTSYLIQYYNSHNAMIIITRTVLMELTSNNFEIHQTQIEFIKDLAQSGIKILIFDEELVVDALQHMIDIRNEDANLLLGYAIKEVIKPKKAVHKIMNNIGIDMKVKILGNKPGTNLLYEYFFQFARNQKVTADSLAEELVLICIIILTKIPLGKKYIFVSDDLVIRPNVIDINTYTKKYHNVQAPYQLTTPTLVYKMFKNSIISSKEDMLAILNAAFNGNVNIYYVGETDIEQQSKPFEKIELVDRIITEEEFRIIY